MTGKFFYPIICFILTYQKYYQEVKMLRKLLFIILLILVIINIVSGSGNKFQQDFSQIVKSLEKKHPGLSPYPLPAMDNKTWQELKKATSHKLSTCETRTDFYFIIRAFLQQLNDGHAYLSYSLRDKSLLPVMGAWFNNKYYIIHVADSRYQELLYSEITAFNEKPLKQIEKAVNQFLSFDQNNYHRLHKPIFGNNLYLTLKDYLISSKIITEDATTINISYIKNEIKKDIEVEFVKLQKPPQYNPFTRNEITSVQNKNFHKIIPDNNTLYVQLSGYQPLAKDFLNNLFKTLKDNKLDNLVLDLRNNGGGQNMDFLLQHFPQYLIKKEQNIYYSAKWMRRGNKNKKTFKGQQKIKPNKENLYFPGNVYLFTGNITFSSAALFTITMKDNGFAQIIGEPCGNNSTRYGQSTRIKLKNTQFHFAHSTAIWQRIQPDNKQKEQFITPHHTVNYQLNDYIEQRDPVWDFYLEYTNKKKLL